MKIKLNKKYKIIIIALSILIIFSITIGITYAYWQITHKQTNNNIVLSGCFDITFEETGNDIKLKNTFPITDQEGLTLTPYKFKIKNICSIDSEYYITLNSFGSTDKLINENAIKYAFDFSRKTNPTPRILGDAPENTNTSNIDLDNLIKSYYLKGGYLRVGEEKEFSLYLWMDELAGNDQMSKIFESKIYITNIATDKAPLIANLKATSSVAATGIFLNGPLVKNKIEKLEFVETNKVPDDAIGSWDVSEQQSGAIMAWYYDVDVNGLYEVYIGQEEGVIANSNSSYLFQNLTELKTISLSNLDTSNVTNMNSMFAYTGNNSPVFTLDLGDQFNTSNVTNMNSMFHYTGYSSPVFTLDLGDQFDTSNVTTMYNMFSYIGYSNTVFILNLGNQFNTSKVTNMSYMFERTGYKSTVFTLNFGDKFDTSSVTNMLNMFSYMCYSNPDFTFNLRTFNFDNVTSYGSIFTGSGTTRTAYVKNAADKTWVSEKGFAGTIIDCSSNTCP